MAHVLFSFLLLCIVLCAAPSTESGANEPLLWQRSLRALQRESGNDAAQRSAFALTASFRGAPSPATGAQLSLRHRMQRVLADGARFTTQRHATGFERRAASGSAAVELGQDLSYLQFMRHAYPGDYGEKALRIQHPSPELKKRIKTEPLPYLKEPGIYLSIYEFILKIFFNLFLFFF